MRSLKLPDFTVETVFRASIERVQDKDLKKRLEACIPEIKKDTEEYALKASNAQLHLIKKKTHVNGDVTREELEAVYTGRMVPKKGPGRFYYEKLRYQTDDGKCPLCAQLPVKTLDHYLAKSGYPSLALSPTNLIPACSDCNKTKNASSPSRSEEEPLHPYFDNINDSQWLFARVIQTTPASLSFYIIPPTGASVLLAQRVTYHFELYQLNSLYSSEAASELRNISYQMKKLYNNGGPDAVKQQLMDRAESSLHENLNSWKSAMFHALANDHWYHTTGVLF
ncbi:HNH endonuclease [Paenibacillus tianmuensis]|uniref:HNH endonuclease n=1 Tax=Paenibacillus tianmuensis TaxID=624147 RepID=A0A1G4U0Z4_9BACL|nr:HNH endonuclease [Paenibacillus tianmuensis]SCW87258.1 HNH endonuclease [Paenibacillus tianmuensis]